MAKEKDPEIVLTPELDAKLTEFAEKQGVSKTEILRQALVIYNFLKKELPRLEEEG